MIKPALLAAVTLFLFGSVLASGQGVHIYHGMHMGEEWDVYFLSKKQIYKGHDTSSYLVTTKISSSVGDRLNQSIIKCSKNSPAIITHGFEGSNQVVHTNLAIGVGPSGFERGMHQKYWYTCHQVMVNPYDKGYPQLAKKHGYATLNKTSTQFTDALKNYPALKENP
jgi:hypothetical protein